MLDLLLTIVIVGLIVWLIQTYAPIPAAFKTICLVVGVVFCIIAALRAFGVALPLLH